MPSGPRADSTHDPGQAGEDSALNQDGQPLLCSPPTYAREVQPLQLAAGRQVQPTKRRDDLPIAFSQAAAQLYKPPAGD